MFQTQKLTDDATKQPVVEITELNPESPISEGSNGAQELAASGSLPQSDDTLGHDQEYATETQILNSHTEPVFDETHDAGSIDGDLTIDTVLDTRLPSLTLPNRRVVSSGQFSTDEHSFDASFANSDDGTGRIEPVKARKRGSGLPPTATARRIWSAETTATSTIGRRTSSQLKTLSLEDRLVKSRSSLKDIQSTCALPSTRDRVTIQHVFELIDKIRMRQVPQQWSPIDKRLKQAQSSAERVADFIGLVKNQGSDADAVASMFYACCELAIQGKVLDSASLDGLLAILNRASVIVQHVKTAVSATPSVSSDLFYVSLSKIVLSLQHICVAFVEMVDELKIDGGRRSTALSIQLNKYFEADIASLTQAAHAACQELWLISLRQGADSTLGSCHGHVLNWLNGHQHCSGGHDHELWRGRGAGHEHAFVFDCVEPMVTKFFKTPSRLLLVTGEVGYGEQEMVFNLIERLQLALPVEAKLLHASLVESSHETKLSAAIPFLKSLLYQLLDQSVGNTGLLAAINLVMKRTENETAVRTEDLLWELLTEQCSKAGGHVAIIVDGILAGEDGRSASAIHLLTKLQELTSKCGNIRCLALADPSSASAVSGVQIYAVSRGDIRRNARQFLQAAIIASATLSVLSAQMRQELLRHITERQWTSLLEAKLILRLLESEHDHGRMPDIICKTPKTVHGMLDHMILKIDFKNPELQTLLSWLLVGKRSVEVSELERYGSVTVSNWLRRVRSGRSVSSNSFLAGIINVQAGRVQFVDSVVKARMHYMALHGKIPLSLHMAHRQVSLDCLKHARQHILQQKVDLVFQDPSSSKWALASSYSDFDGLLVYAIRNWYDHYEKSLTSSEKLSRRIPAEISANLPDSVLMGLAEWYYLRAETLDPSGLSKALSKVLALRKSVFGPQAQSVIQTMINLAHVEQATRSLGASGINTERLVAAFEAIVLAYGDPSPQATVGAKYIFSILKPQKSLPFKGFTVYRYLWSVYRQELGESHDDTLLVAQRLAELYNAEMRFADAAEILHDMYEACCRTKGLFAGRSISIFHLLIDALEHSDNMSEAEQLCIDVFDAAPSLETWNDAVLSAVCRIVRHFHGRGMAEVSKSRLQQLWTLLQGQFKKDNNQGHLLVTFTSISLQLAKKMRDLSLEGEAASTLASFWAVASKYVTTDRHCELNTLAQFREISQLLLRLDHHEEALSILRVIYEMHQLPTHDHFDEMLQVYSALISCYKLTKSPIQDFLWLNILDNILVTASAHGNVGADTVFLCRDLAVLHRARSQWTAASSICRKSLNVLWSQIFSQKEGEIQCLPKSYTRECIQMAVIMVQMNLKINEKKQADTILQTLLGCCKRYILQWASSGLEIANILSLALEEAELVMESLQFWKSILGDCRSHLGHSHPFTLQVAAAIVRLSLKLDLTIDDDEIVCGVLETEPDDDDLESISVLIEGLLALCRNHGAKKRDNSSLLLKWYERLWAYYFDLRHDLAMETSRGFEIFQGYCAVLMSMNSISMAIRLARKLRATFLSDFGRQDIWYLKASLELTKLLELDDTTMREAVDIYDEMNDIGMILCTTDEAILAILRIAQERLSILVSSKPILHDRAGSILIKAWQQAVKKNSHSHEHAITSLQKLFAFWASIGKAEYRKQATDTLKEAILGTISKETNPCRLFQLAQSFCSMSQMFNLTYRDLGFLGSVRTSIFRSSGKTKGLCGQAYLEQDSDVSGSYDRRCLVLIYSMEKLFQKQNSDSLLVEMLTRVVAEAALYEAWLRASREGSHLNDLMTSGTRLIEHLAKYKLQSESLEVKGQLWTLFCRSLGRTDERKSGSTHQFFEDILAVSQQNSISVSLLETALIRAQRLADAGSHHACLRLSEWIYSYGKASSDLEENSEAALLLLKLATLLYTCSEAEKSPDLAGSIEDLATRVGILTMSYTTEVDLSVMSISHLTFILGIAGKQKDYKTLKHILELLWNSRNNYDFNLTPTTTVSIGKRLAEVHFACGEHAVAFALLEDITYNLKDVYGVNHPMALQCQRLLASMHENLGQRKSAIGVRFGMLKDALCVDEDADDVSGAGMSLDESTSFYVNQLRSLRHEYATTEEYSWHLEQNMDSLGEIIGRVKTLVGGKAADHDAENILDLGEWRDLEQLEVGDDVFETWRAPDDWMVNIELEDDCDESAWSAVDV